MDDSINLPNEWKLPVRFVDGNEITFESEIMVEVTGDQYAPIRIQVPGGKVRETESILLAGKVEDEGTQRGVSERGFVIAGYPEPELSGEGVEVIVTDGQGDVFEYLVPPGYRGVYYYRAYAVNEEGVSYGSTEYFETVDESKGHGWTDGYEIADTEGWWSSPWFGEYYQAGESGWLLHAELGWMYGLPQGDDTAGVWLWQERLGWVWTRSDLYPFLYRNDTGSWVFLHGRGSGDRLLLYDYQSNYWTTVGTP